MRLHIIGRSKAFDLFPRTHKGKNRCVLRKKHALINSREPLLKSDINLEQSSHVETVVLLSKGMVDKDNFRNVKVDFSLEDMDLAELRGKATYAQVKEYILKEFGLKVSSLYIAQVKKKCGIETGENYNLPRTEDDRQPQVTPEKEEAIMKAFTHFGVI